jgi:ubiquinone biosynthesis protein
MLAGSAWAAGRPGLPEAADAWFRTLPGERRRLATTAQGLARPRLWHDTVGAAARAGWKVVGAAAPEAAYALVGMGARAAGLPVGPPDRTGAVVARVEGLVRDGGPAYVKLGQFIATARGLLPDEWVDAFAWCRDRVPAMRPGTAERIAARAFDLPLDMLFSSFDPEPLGSASIGQAHGAVLADGTEVVVKVRRPRLRAGFGEAIQTLALVAAAAEGRVERARSANVAGIVALFAELVLEELDFRFEALNMVELGLVTEDAGMAEVRVPRPVPGLVTERALVMERVPGRPYTEAVAEHGPALDGERLVRLAIQGVLEHALAYGVFHGDLHAGNVLVDEHQGFSLVDFGICGRVDAAQRRALVRLTVAYAQQDAAGQVRALREFGALPADVDVAALAAEVDAAAVTATATADRPGAGAGPVGLADVVAGMGATMQVLAAGGFRLPKDLVLFFRNLLYLNGFAQAVAPDTNLLNHVEPVLAWFQSRHGARLAEMVVQP